MDFTENNTHSRPTRKAATEAKKKINASVKAVIKTKKKFKYGWSEYDNSTDWDTIERSNIPDSVQDTTESFSSTTPSQPPTPSQEEISSDNSDEDLAWDTSPEQYMLMPESPPPDPTTFASTPKMDPTVQNPRIQQRNRVYAMSTPSLSRSPAFRIPKQHDQAFLATPFTKSRPVYTPAKPSRIPKPFSPTQVDTQQVTDLSNLPNPLTQNPRRSARISSLPQPNYQDRHSSHHERSYPNRNTRKNGSRTSHHSIEADKKGKTDDERRKENDEKRTRDDRRRMEDRRTMDDRRTKTDDGRRNIEDERQNDGRRNAEDERRRTEDEVPCKLGLGTVLR